MDDTKIREEFEKYLNGAIDTKATMFGYGYNTDRKGSKAGYKNMAQGFYAGFRAAERLAKIESLEDVRREMLNENNDYEDMMSHMDRMIAELKEEGE